MARPLRLIAIAMSAMISLALLAGCSGHDTDSGNNTTATESVIKVDYQQSVWYNDIRVLIEAVPADYSRSVTVLTAGNGSYDLAVKPGMNYSLKGRVYDPFGQDGYVRFAYPGLEEDRNITVSEGETVIASAEVWFVHAPKGIRIFRDPVTGSRDMFKPTVPVILTGHVYFDNQTVSGAHVVAYWSSFRPENMVTAVTDESGAYVMTVDSRTQYTVSANYHGLSRSTWPVIIQDNMTGVCDINITWTTISTISGAPDDGQPWLAQADNVITAIPVGGGQTLTALSSPDGSYSLDVKPFTYYDLTGQVRGPDGQRHNLRFVYGNGVSCTGFMLRENETVSINYYAADVLADQ